MRNKEQITIKILKVIYLKEDSRWHILKTDKGQTKGVIRFDVKPDDMLTLEGSWQTSKFNGNQEFIFTQAMLSIPDDPRALLKYAVELTKGLGEAAEERIWQRYGDKWREADLSDLPKITDDARFNWQSTLQRLDEQKEQAQAIAFLLGKEATLNMACSAWNKFSVRTITTVTANCYELADLPHYGFKDVDEKIRANFGIEDADPRRLDAAILYVMDNLTQTVGSLLGREAIVNELMKIIPDAYQGFDDRMKFLESQRRVKILDSGNFARMEDYENETAIWEGLCR